MWGSKPKKDYSATLGLEAKIAPTVILKCHVVGPHALLHEVSTYIYIYIYID